jgi:hypothetical protein
VEGAYLRTFIRARVMFDITKPLPTGCWVHRKELPRMWIIVKFEKLLDLYYNSGVIGHDQRGCKRERAKPVEGVDLPRYGQSLNVPTAKSLTSLFREQLAWANPKIHQSSNNQYHSSRGGRSARILLGKAPMVKT